MKPHGGVVVVTVASRQEGPGFWVQHWDYEGQFLPGKEGKDLAYDQMVCEHKTTLSDHHIQNPYPIEQNTCLVLKLTETEEQLASAELTVNNQTWQQKYDDLEEKNNNSPWSLKQQGYSPPTSLYSRQEADNQQLEAEYKLLKIKTEALAALQKIRQMEDIIPKGDQITRIQEAEDDKTVLENICPRLLSLTKARCDFFFVNWNKNKNEPL